MSEKKLRGSDMSMSESVLVERAKAWTESLCRDEQHGRTDFTEAMRRLALRLRIPFGFLRELTYRPPKRISAGRFLILAKAYDEHLQRKKYREEQTEPEPSWLRQALLRSADALEGRAAALDGEAEAAAREADALDREADALNRKCRQIDDN